MRRLLTVALILVLAAVSVCSAAEQPEEPASPIPVKVLLLPKFEEEEMEGDFPGEAQDYYEQYLSGGEAFDVPHCSAPLYYKDGVAMCVLGMGKINAALNTMAVLSDSRFDFSEAYIISTGCAGSSAGSTVMGDVFILSSAVDYDLGHHADARDIADPEGTTWFHDGFFDSTAVVFLNQELTDKVYSLVKDTAVRTTETTRNFMRAAFDGADWAVRDPQVLRGTAVTGDNYWKGLQSHKNAQLMTETYQCPDPYAVTEMEEVAVAQAAEHMGLLDRLIMIRVSVNMDVFMMDATPESLWGETANTDYASVEDVEQADIFETAMENNFDVGRIIIDRILEGRF